MEYVAIFKQTIPLNDILEEKPEGCIDLPEAYSTWLEKEGERIEIIDRKFSAAGPIPGLRGGHIIMAIAVFYRLKNKDTAG